MESSKSPMAAVAGNWHQQYAKCKSKSSFMVLMGCMALIVSSLFTLACLSLPTGSPLIAQVMTSSDIPPYNKDAKYEMIVKEVLERATMQNKTVIITTLNAAWAKEGTMIDLFLKSFFYGNDTHKLLQHLVIVCVDDKAYKRCLIIHPHCLYIKTSGVNFSKEQIFQSSNYINLMWRRIKFLKTVLEMNYNFIFTDADVLWLKNPFHALHNDTEADFQIACDRYNGIPRDISNHPNAGFIYVHSNTRTVRFYDYWYGHRNRYSNDQEVFNAIKFDKEFTSINMSIRFLDTQFFGGFCGLETTDMTKAITMHANCCKSIKAKLFDLRMMLDGWKKWHAQNYLMMSTITNSVATSLHNESTSPSTPNSLSRNVQEADLNPHFKIPLACPQAWH